MRLPRPIVPRASRPSASPEEAPRLGLVFEAGRGKLRLERPVTLAAPRGARPIVARSLELSIGPVRFPLDVSGGSGRFRTRRLGLVAAEIVVPLGALEVLVASRLRWMGRAGAVRVRLVSDDPARGACLLVTLVPQRDASSPIVFAVELLADGLDLLAVVHDARAAADGPAAPTSIALASMSAIGASWDGSAMRFVRPHERLGRELLVTHGYRLPDAREVCTVAPRVEDDALVLAWSSAPDADAVVLPQARALDAARRLGACDGALARGDREAARAALAEALAQLPRAPPLLERLAELDADEPALEPSVRSILSELDAGAARSRELAAALRFRLAARAHDAEAAAREALTLAADPLAPELAAFALASAGTLLLPRRPEAGAALLWRASALRRNDAELHARLLRAAGAAGLDLASVEELGARWLAAVSSADERARAAIATAAACASIGALPEARAWNERALRYRPRSREALLELGRVLLALTDAGRALRVLGRALDACDAARDDAMAAEALLLISDVHERLAADAHAALDAATAACGRAPGSARAWSRVAELRERIGEAREAAVAAARANDETRRAAAATAAEPAASLAQSLPAATRASTASTSSLEPERSDSTSSFVPASAPSGPPANPADGPHVRAWPTHDESLASQVGRVVERYFRPTGAAAAAPPASQLAQLRRTLEGGGVAVAQSTLSAAVTAAISDPATPACLATLRDLVVVGPLAARPDVARVAAHLAGLLEHGVTEPLGARRSLSIDRRRELVRSMAGDVPLVDALERIAESIAARHASPSRWVAEVARDHDVVRLAHELSARLAVRPRALALGAGDDVEVVMQPEGVTLVVGGSVLAFPERAAFLLARALVALQQGACALPSAQLVGAVREAMPGAPWSDAEIVGAREALSAASSRVAAWVLQDPGSAIAALTGAAGHDLARLPDPSARERAVAVTRAASELGSWALRGDLLAP